MYIGLALGQPSINGRKTIIIIINWEALSDPGKTRFSEARRQNRYTCDRHRSMPLCGLLSSAQRHLNLASNMACLGYLTRQREWVVFL